MHKPLVESSSLLFLCVIVYFISRFQKNDLPFFVIGEIVAQCEFSPPQDYRLGPYPRGINWCNSGNLMETKRLITHLKQYSTGMDISFASEFGSHVKVAYIVKSDVVLINPRIVTRSSEAIFCEDDVGGIIESQYRAESVYVEFLDEHLEKQMLWFYRGDSCRIQTVISVM